jgi:hypothetical protein
VGALADLSLVSSGCKIPSNLARLAEVLAAPVPQLSSLAFTFKPDE